MSKINQQNFRIRQYEILGKAVFQPPHQANFNLQRAARVLYVVNGQSSMYSPIGKIELTNGDAIVMKSDKVLNHWKANEDNADTEIIVFQLFPEIVQHIFGKDLEKLLKPNNKTPDMPIVKIPKNPILGNFMEGLQFYFNHPQLMNEQLLTTKIQELLLLLKHLNDTTIQSIFSELFLSKTYEFQKIIQAHIFENINLNDLAFLSGMSLSSFQRKFKNIYGTSPAKYIRLKRLEEAKRLLQNPTLRISDVAYQIGFEDLGHFSKAFHLHYRITPTRFRKTLIS